MPRSNFLPSAWPSSAMLFLLSVVLLHNMLAIDLVVGSQMIDSDDDSSGTVCKQRSACRCLNSHGEGIDIESLSNYKYLATPPQPDNISYYFHPCQDVDMHIFYDVNQTATCLASTLCLLNRTTGTVESLGRTSDTEFHNSVTNGRFLVIKQKQAAGGSPTATKTTLIQLACTNVEPDRLFALQPETEDNAQINLILYSAQACMRPLADDNSLSTGAVLIITLCCLVFAYVVLGMTLNYFVVGARGIEMMPHLSFWRDFPALVREGVAFLQNGCTPATRDDLMTPNTPNQDSYVSI